jgi:Domain of unknown function (DUF4160)
MAQVFSIFNLRVVIYPNDHRPSHVHVIGKGCEAVFNLHCPVGPTELRVNFGFSRKDLEKIDARLTGYIPLLCKYWREIHGNY